MKPLIIVDTSAHDRMMNRWGGYFGRFRPLRDSNGALEDVSLHGYALLYNEPLAYENEIWFFEPGCLRDSLMGSAPIFFQLDHNDSTRIASTRDGALQFADDDVGLAFTLDLEDSPKSAALKREVESDKRAAVSVGIRNEQSHIKMFGEHAVKVITKATLIEVSMVAAGKCESAFVATAGNGEPLAAGKKSPMFIVNVANHKLKRVARIAADNRRAVQSIASKLDAITGKQSVNNGKSNLDIWYERWCNS